MSMTTTGNPFNNVVSLMARRVFAGYLACKNPALFTACNRSSHCPKLGRPHLSNSGGL